MFFFTLFIASTVIAIIPNCLANDCSVVPFLKISYKLIHSDSTFDLVLQKLGITNGFQRLLLETVQPRMTLTWDPDTDIYTLSRQSQLLSDIFSFKLDKKFHRKTVDGRHIENEFTMQGRTLKEVQTQHGKPPLVIRRHFEQDSVITVVQIENIVSYRMYDSVTE